MVLFTFGYIVSTRPIVLTSLGVLLEPYCCANGKKQPPLPFYVHVMKKGLHRTRKEE